MIKRITYCCLICILSIFIFCNCTNSIEDSLPFEDYTYIVETFTNVSTSDIERMQEENQVFYLYVGRESCHYCQQFVTSIYPLVKEQNTKIYYLDSISSYENSPQEIKFFRDKYSIESVPFFVIFKGENIVVCKLLIKLSIFINYAL